MRELIGPYGFNPPISRAHGRGCRRQVGSLSRRRPWNQLQPLVVPQDSQTKQEPAGRMRTPQVEQKGASTAAIPGVNASSLRGEAGPTVGGAAAAAWEVPASLAAAGSPASAGAAGGSGGSAPGPRAPVAAGAGCGAAGAAPVAVGPLPLASSIRSAVVLIPSSCL